MDNTHNNDNDVETIYLLLALFFTSLSSAAGTLARHAARGCDRCWPSPAAALVFNTSMYSHTAAVVVVVLVACSSFAIWLLIHSCCS